VIFVGVISKLTERSLNVYENKGPVWKNVTAAITPAEAGVHLGGVDSRLRRNDTWAVVFVGVISKLTEGSLNVYENKGPGWKNVTAAVTPAEAGVHAERVDSRLRGNDS
jgi:hypothetical protein